jgi:hypothetical protein
MVDEDILIPIVGMMIPIVIVPTVLTLKHLQRKQETQHKERLRALELGRVMPTSNFWPSLAAISIGAVVPIGSFLIAWMATMTHAAGDEAILAAMIVAIVAVVQGSRLALRMMDASRRAEEEAPSYLNQQKPFHDPDSIDVVSRRG